MINRFFRFLHRKKTIYSTNYGRNCGWHIEFDGVIIGELIDYQQLDMFWDSYLVVIRDDVCDSILHEPSNWHQYRFRNKRLDEYAPNAFTGGDYIEFCERKTNRISMRGLYIL